MECDATYSLSQHAEFYDMEYTLFDGMECCVSAASASVSCSGKSALDGRYRGARMVSYTNNYLFVRLSGHISGVQ